MARPEYWTELLREFARSRDSKLIPEQAIRAIAGGPQNTIRGSDGVILPGGVATVLNESGAPELIRFWKCPDPTSDETWNQVVEHLSNRPGLDPNLHGDKDGLIIKGSPIQETPDGVQVSSSDVYLRQVGDLVLMGSTTAVLTMPTNEIKKLLDDLGDKDWVWRLIPENIPLTLRSSMLTAIVLQAAPGLQQVDEEAKSEYVLRKEAGLVALRILQVLGTDTERVDLWMSLPTASRSMRASLRLVAQPNSELATIISQSTPIRTVFPSAATTDELATLNVNLTIPEFVQPLASAFVEMSQHAVYSDVRFPARAIVSAPVNGLFVLVSEPQDGLMAGLGLCLSGELPVEFDEAELVRDVSKWPALNQGKDRPQDVAVFTEVADRLLRVSCAHSATSVIPTLIDVPESNSGQIGSTAIDLHVDLEKWLSESSGSPTRLLLDQLEAAWFDWNLEQTFRGTPPALRTILRRNIGRGSLLPGPDEINESSDWSAHGTIRFGEQEIIANLDLGADLFGYGVVSSLVLNDRVAQSVNGGNTQDSLKP